MKANVGGLDKAIRLIIAAFLIILYLNNSFGPWVNLVLIVPAAVLLLTALAGTCPLYRLLGINTRKKGQEHGNAKII